MKTNMPSNSIQLEPEIDTINLAEAHFPVTAFRYEALLEKLTALEDAYALLERRYNILRKKLKDANLE